MIETARDDAQHGKSACGGNGDGQAHAHSLAEIAPALKSSTCRLRIWTAGSALMMNQPISMASGMSSHSFHPLRQRRAHAR